MHSYSKNSCISNITNQTSRSEISRTGLVHMKKRNFLAHNHKKNTSLFSHKVAESPIHSPKCVEGNGQPETLDLRPALTYHRKIQTLAVNQLKIDKSNDRGKRRWRSIRSGGTHVGLEEGDVVLVERPRVLLVEQVIIGIRRHGVAAGSSPATAGVRRELCCVELVRCDPATGCPSRSPPFSVSFLLGKPSGIIQAAEARSTPKPNAAQACCLAQMRRNAGPSSMFDSTSPRLLTSVSLLFYFDCLLIYHLFFYILYCSSMSFCCLLKHIHIFSFFSSGSFSPCFINYHELAEPHK